MSIAEIEQSVANHMRSCMAAFETSIDDQPPLSAYCAICNQRFCAPTCNHLCPPFLVAFRGSSSGLFHTIMVTVEDGFICIHQNTDLPGTQPTPRLRLFNGRMVDLLQAFSNVANDHEMTDNFAAITSVELLEAQRIQILIVKWLLCGACHRRRFLFDHSTCKL